MYLSSTFNHSLGLKGMRAHPPFPVWFSPFASQDNPIVHPHKKNFVGHISFDPRKFCVENCYAGFSLNSSRKLTIYLLVI